MIDKKECKIRSIYPEIKDQRECERQGKLWYTSTKSRIGRCIDPTITKIKEGTKCNSGKIKWQKYGLDEKQCQIQKDNFKSND